MQKTGVPGEKPVEASLDWKPNGHTASGLGITPWLNGPRCQGSTTTLPASPRCKQHISRQQKQNKNNKELATRIYKNKYIGLCG